MDTREITNAYRITKWADIVKQCRTIGQTVSVWCEENGVNEKSYYYWQKRVREAATNAVSNTIRLPVETSNPFEPIELPKTSNTHVQPSIVFCSDY